MKDINSITIKEGDRCKVHPTATSKAREAYFVKIVRDKDFDFYNRDGLVAQGLDYKVSINDYFLKRLEVVKNCDLEREQMLELEDTL